MSEKAAEREQGNPKCGVCGVYPTNHFCSFVSAEGTQCSKPVCAICRGESGPTRCSDHLWSDKMLNHVSVPSTEAEKETCGPIGNKKARRIVARKVQQLCFECKNHSTPSICVECKVPVCTSCKLKLNGSLGSYCCSVHAKKVEISVVVNRTVELQRNPAGTPADGPTGTVAEGVPDLGRMEKTTENSVPQKGKLTNNKNSTRFLSSTNHKRKKSKSAKASSAIVANETDSLLHKAVSYDIDSNIGNAREFHCWHCHSQA
jgi:hypothetical protein